MDDDYANMRPV